MANGQRGLAEQSGGRFLLGVGVSHRPAVEGLRGHSYGRPVATMRAYLKAMREIPYPAPPPPEPPLTIVAALGPRMMALSAAMADGAHPYNTTPEHTAQARAILGPDAFLAVSLVAALSEDPARGRELGRRYVGDLSLPNYRNNLLRLGWSENQLTGPSDEVIDALVAWGSPEAIAERVRAHLDAGASHVCLNVQAPEPDGLPMAEWTQLAEVMKDLVS
jgi:probable F420-dependent oxidoreductase